MSVAAWKTKLRNKLARRLKVSTESIKLVPQPVRRKGGIPVIWEPIGDGRVLCPVNGKIYAVYQVVKPKRKT